MTRTTQLFDRFLTRNNFHLAFKRVAAKGSAGGIDRVSVAEFASRGEANLDKLLKQLRSGEYCPEPVAGVTAPKFGKKGGVRELGLPTVADKVVQTALLQVVEPLAEKLFLNTSYGYRPGKGPGKALRRVEHELRQHRTWLVSRDIDNFFDSLDHNRLLALFSDLVAGDHRLVELVALWCKMGIVQKDGRWRNVMTGVRQGQVVSPLLANLYLHDLDRFVSENGWSWVRYADDTLLLCRDQSEAEAADLALVDFLRSIHLSFNAEEQPIASLAEGFTFLGVHFQGESRSIAPDKVAKMERTIDWLLSPKGNLGPAELLTKLSQSLEGWRRYYGFLDPGREFARLNKRVGEKLGELLEHRRSKGIWTTDMIEPLSIPSLPGAGESDQLAQGKDLRRLWQDLEKKSHPTDLTQPEKKIAKRRRSYLHREVVGSELLVTTPGAFVGKRGERVFVREKQRILAEVPVIKLHNIAVAGNGVTLSSDVIRLCAERGIVLSFLDGLGKTYAVAAAPAGIESELVLRQLESRESVTGLNLARMFVWGKMKNQQALLKSYRKYQGRHGSRFEQEYADRRDEMQKLIVGVKTLTELTTPKHFRQSLLGYEGRFASCYWNLIAQVLPEQCKFPGRDKQGASDLVNSLLNYGYGILYNHTLQAVIKSGLNATIGFLHANQPGKPSLVFDLVEEFRTMVVDRAVFTLLNRGEAVSLGKDQLLTTDTRKKLAGAVLARLATMIKLHGRSCCLREGLYLQAQAIRYCLLSQGSYHPYLARW
jgi:group II intron reverse transcriptase/maturase/CRISPR-associated endonuclease Cas1